MGSRNSTTTKYRAGPGFFLDKNGCVVDVCGNSCNPCNPCMPQFNQCNPCLPQPQFNTCAPCQPCQPCQPCSPYPFSQFPYACGQPCCEPEMLNMYARDEQPQLNIYNYTYEKPCDPYFFNSANQCFPTFSNRYIQPCFQKQYGQVSMNPFQGQCGDVCDLPYIQPFVQSFQNYVPQRCDTPVFPPLAMPAVLPNAQQFLNPFASFCSQNYFPAPSFQPNLQSQFQQLPQFQPQQLNFPPPLPPVSLPQNFQPPCPQNFAPPCPQSFPPPSFQPPCPSFQPPCQQFQPCPPSFPQSFPASCRPPCSIPIAMPYSFPQQQLPQLPSFQNCFQNPLLEHFAQLSARPCNFGYSNPWI